ncbi:MAG: AMP-binding protein [Nocardioidaceae bacterium]
MRSPLTELLLERADDDGRVFLVLEDGSSVTYAEQFDRSARVAAALISRGAAAGKRVLVTLGNCREFYDIWFGSMLAGAVLVPANPQSSPAELDHIRADAEPALEVASPADVTAMLAHPAVDEFPGRAPEDVAAILYTSGTTSRAKGVMVTETNYVAVGQAVADQVGLTAEDRWLVVLPLFHANAQFYSSMSALVRGASVALVSKFSASGWGRQARDMGATLASLFAAPVRMILAKAEDPEDAHNSLRLVLFAQNLADQDVVAFERRFATRLVQLYGMTETVLPPTMNPLVDGIHHSIGQALPQIHIDLVDEDGRVTGEDTGEMRIVGVPGRTLALGYWRNPSATAETFTDRGLRTGDIARRDGAGFYYFAGRSKDMIKRSGENVSAGEVEDAASSHPGVMECAAIGIPDPMRDEAIVLVVVSRAGTTPRESDIIEWCGARLSSFKVPSFVTFVDALPRTSVGKIRKTELRTALAAEHSAHRIP